MIRKYILPLSINHLACFHILKIHSNLCSDTIAKPQVRCSNLEHSNDRDIYHPIILYNLSRKMHLKGILLLDCVNWGSKVPQLVYGLKLASGMNWWSAAMTRTCRVLGCVNETQYWVSWSCSHVERGWVLGAKIRIVYFPNPVVGLPLLLKCHWNQWVAKFLL